MAKTPEGTDAHKIPTVADQSNKKYTQERELNEQARAMVADLQQRAGIAPYHVAHSVAQNRAAGVTDEQQLAKLVERVHSERRANDYTGNIAVWRELGHKPVSFDRMNTWAERLAIADELDKGYPVVVAGKPVFPFADEPAMTKEDEEAHWKWIVEVERALDVSARNRLKTVSDMLKTPAIDWMVEGRIHRSGLSQIFGPSYSGKTLLVLDLFLSWCAGLSHWQGLPLNNGEQPQDGVYVAAEGGAALSVHIDAWLKHHREVSPDVLDKHAVFLDGGDGHFMHLPVRAPGKRRDDDYEIPYENSFDRMTEEIVGLGLSPSLMVFDTQIDLAPGIDENSNAEMVDLLSRIKKHADTFKYMAIVVHHTGHEETRARGASGMKAKVDVQAQLSVDKTGGFVSLTWSKVKGAQAPKETVDYRIKGQDQLPELESEGAICEPFHLGTLARMIGTEPPSGIKVDILDMCRTPEGLPASKIAEALNAGVSRNSKKFKDWIDYLTREGGELRKSEGANRNSVRYVTR